PFSKKDIRTDGKEMFACILEDEEKRQVYEVISKNMVFESIILPVLRQIDYDQATALARKWHLAELVVIDPAISFGKPIIEPTWRSSVVPLSERRWRKPT